MELYRIVNRWSVLVMETYTVIKETDKSYKLSNGRYIRKKSKRKYACKTIEEAKVSFEARKIRQIKILQNQLKESNNALALIRSGEIKYEFTFS